MKKRKIKFRFKLLLLTLFLVYAGISICLQQENIGMLLDEQKALNERYEEAQTELERLEHKNEYMNTEKYVENAAREKLGLAYKDELVITPEDKTEE